MSEKMSALDRWNRSMEPKGGTGNYAPFAKFAKGETKVLLLADFDVEGMMEFAPHPAYTVEPEYLTEEERKSPMNKFGKKYSYEEGDDIDPRYIEQRRDKEQSTDLEKITRYMRWDAPIYIFNLTAYAAVQKIENGMKMKDLKDAAEREYAKMYASDEDFTGIFFYEMHSGFKDRVNQFVQEQLSEGNQPRISDYVWKVAKQGAEKPTYYVDVDRPKNELPQEILDAVDEIVEEVELKPLSEIIDSKRYRGSKTDPEGVSEEYSFANMRRDGGNTEEETPVAGPPTINWGSA